MRTFVSTILMQRLPFSCELLSISISSLVVIKTAMSFMALITQHCWGNSWTWCSLRSLPTHPILPFYATSTAQVSRSHITEVSAQIYSREITEDEHIHDSSWQRTQLEMSATRSAGVSVFLNAPGDARKKHLLPQGQWTWLCEVAKDLFFSSPSLCLAM